jgi:hypothetical protein
MRRAEKETMALCVRGLLATGMCTVHSMFEPTNLFESMYTCAVLRKKRQRGQNVEKYIAYAKAPYQGLVLVKDH